MRLRKRALLFGLLLASTAITYASSSVYMTQQFTVTNNLSNLKKSGIWAKQPTAPKFWLQFAGPGFYSDPSPTCNGVICPTSEATAITIPFGGKVQVVYKVAQALKYSQAPIFSMIYHFHQTPGSKVICSEFISRIQPYAYVIPPNGNSYGNLSPWLLDNTYIPVETSGMCPG